MSLIFTGCINSQKLIKNDVTFQEPVIEDIPFYDSSPDIFIPIFLDSIRLGLRKGYLPTFMLDECLDIHRPYEYSSHTFTSTRYILFQKLNRQEIKKMLNLSKRYNLAKQCKSDASNILINSNCTGSQVENSKKSTLDLLHERWKEFDR